MRWLQNWWRQGDNFGWLSGYLQTHGLADVTRRTLAVVAASLAWVPVNVLWGPAPFNRLLALILATLAAVAGLVLAAIWWTRWPTRRQSIAYAVIGSLTIAGGCLWLVDPVVGLMSCAALAISGGYVALFHTAGYMAMNFALAVCVGAFQAIRLALDGQTVLALTGYFLILELNIAAPFAIQLVVRLLAVDLARSDRDPLTGLLNRRAIAHAAVGRFVLAAADHLYAAVAMIDLDRFKALNDERGHAAGDEALVAVAAALRAACRDAALVGRIGGEEFLVVDIVSTRMPSAWGQRLCQAVSSTPTPVTASVGIATIELRDVDRDRAENAFRALVAAADNAMYTAKRRGGDRIHHHCWSTRDHEWDPGASCASSGIGAKYAAAQHIANAEEKIHHDGQLRLRQDVAPQ